MGVKKIRKSKPKPKPKPVIDYPPVPTRKWIPPDQRKKAPPPEPKYVKPEGISQKLAISTLKKVWNKYEIYGDAAIITGHFSQTHKRFSFKSNGLQGACNSAIACIYSHLYKMSTWTSCLLDDIIIRGDELYVKSTQQGDRCLIEVPPEKMHTSFFLGNDKVTLFVSPNDKVTEELTSVSVDKAKEILVNSVGKFLEEHPSGIFYVKEKYVAIWRQDGVYYFFDPEEHDECGNLWTGVPGYGVSFLGRFKKLPALVEYLYKNFPSAKEPYCKFHIMPCGIARIVHVSTTPPETFEDLAPQDVILTQIIEEPPSPPNTKQEQLKEYVDEDKSPIDPMFILVQEISPEVGEDMPSSRRPSFLKEGPVQKNDSCRYPVPLPTYLKGEHARLTYYTEIIPEEMGILRASTCQTNPNFSKYLGRQSMGNALSALIMLRFWKARHWIPRTLDTILKYGEKLYRDAMMNIPRTRTLRLSDFPEKIEYENRKFTPDIDEYALVGQLQSQEFDILDLGPALDEFLADHDCCIILGPLVVAVWLEDGVFYMFDPNERNQEGKAIIRTAIVNANVINLEQPIGVACVVWCKNLKDLINLYMNNTEKVRRSDRFYLSKVSINDYVEVSENWNNFKGIDIEKWILRGTFNQASIRFCPESRNTQGTANALIALAMATFIDEADWTPDIVDEILMSGDAFYKDSVKRLKDRNLFNDRHLMLAELNKSHRLRDKEAYFELEECLVNGIICAKNVGDVSDLRKGLEEYFQDNDYCVLTVREISIAIWKKKDAFYYLDPYSRDHKGVSTGYGTSCALRLVHLPDLALCIEANLDPDREDFFNITKVKVILYEAGTEGTVKPALNNYTTIGDKSAILRGWLSEQSAKYETRKGKQTVPMCLTAVGFNKLKPAGEWTKNDMDAILDKGDNLYVESMVQAQKNLDDKRLDAEEVDAEARSGAVEDLQAGGDAKPVEPKETPETDVGIPNDDEEKPAEFEIKITSENVEPEVTIGPNEIVFEFSDVAEGNIKASLKESLRNYFENEQTDDNFNQEALLETKHYTVALWRDNKAYYVFDPKPRDKSGEVIGREDWDPEPPEPDPEPEESTPDVMGKSDEDDVYIKEGNENDEDAENITETEPEKNEEENEDAAEEVEDEENDLSQEKEETSDINAEPTEEEQEGEQKETEVPHKPKKSPSYWLEQEKSGRACTVWFVNLDDLIEFVYENIEVNDRLNSDFTLKKVNVINNLKVKSKFNNQDERLDAYAGDWYYFKEIEHGKWILRASLDISHELFPENNRGKQGLTCSVVALGVAHTFEMTCFSDTVPDAIIVYGDKLLTFMKKSRKKQLMNDPKTNLKEDEVDWLVQHEEFTINDIPKKICLSKFMVELDVSSNVVTGDVKAQDFEEILDVERGLEKFFEDSSYGVLFSKGVYVAVWKGQKMFYMFDGMKRGPSGTQSIIGTGCITRYLELGKLAEVFLNNLPLLGKSEFVIHRVLLRRNLCPRDKEPKEVVPAPKAVSKSAGLKLIMPGKQIICGTISQEDPRFGKGPDVMSAAIAVVALTMSLIHKPETWSRPIIDEIVISGSELYEDSVNELGFEFNPWEDKLDIYRVKNDFKLGVVKANCELRNMDQRGYIDVQGSNLQNLRQGMERFFEENTHGVLITEPTTVAVWEQKQDEGDPLIFIFDPNPRSSTGMPLFTGTACALSFVNAKMASDHIIGCILDPAMRAGEFVILPVEIVVGNVRTKRKSAEKSPTRSSVNILPRCSKLVASEQKKKLRKLAEEDRKRKEAKKQQMIGRNGYHLRGNEALLRGYKCQNSSCYENESRNKQDIPNCIVSVVMHTLLPIDEWNYRHIDLILDTGDQLYIDSYIAYGPKDPKLGMENILRKFYMGNLEIHLTVYKPIITELFTPTKLSNVLESFFQQETVCILNYSQQWVSIFFKTGYYFLFDPHERDIEGNIIKSNSSHGSAVVVRFETINSMTSKIINNLGGNSDDADMFSLWIISVNPK